MLPHRKHNLFYLADVVDEVGPVLLTKTGAYMENKDSIAERTVKKPVGNAKRTHVYYTGAIQKYIEKVGGSQGG